MDINGRHVHIDGLSHALSVNRIDGINLGGMINERYCRYYTCLYPANSGIYSGRNDSLSLI